MRYLVGFVFVLAVMASPLSVSAQAAEEAATAGPGAEETTPASEPAVKLELDKADVHIVQSPPRTGDGYIVVSEEMKVRDQMRKGRACLIAGGVLTAIGGTLLAVGITYDSKDSESVSGELGLIGAGAGLGLIGVGTMMAGGSVLGSSKRKLRRLQEANYGTPRRAQWDVARSRLVF